MSASKINEGTPVIQSPHSELSIQIFQKENGIWRVGAFHNTTVAATLNRDSPKGLVPAEEPRVHRSSGVQLRALAAETVLIAMRLRSGSRPDWPPRMSTAGHSYSRFRQRPSHACYIESERQQTTGVAHARERRRKSRRRDPHLRSLR